MVADEATAQAGASSNGVTSSFGWSAVTRFTEKRRMRGWFAAAISCQAQDAEQEIAAANHPRIRLFSVKRVTALQPKDDVTPFDDAPAWAVASSATIPHFSAVGYFFARALQRARGD